MNLTVRHVEATHIQQVWPLVGAFIEDALSKVEGNPDYNIHHVQSFLTSGQWLLLVAVDEEGVVHGAATVSFINYPMHRVAFITAIGGKLISNQETFDQLRNLMKSYGATKIQGFGRESIVRLWQRYNFEPRNTLVEVLL